MSLRKSRPKWLDNIFFSSWAQIPHKHTPLQNCCEGITGEHHVITSCSNCSYVLDLTKSLKLVCLKVSMKQTLLPGRDSEVTTLEKEPGMLNQQ